MRKGTETREVRRPRLRRARPTPGVLVGIGLLAVAGVLAIAAGSWGLSALGGPSDVPAPQTALPPAEASVTVAPPMIEVPSLGGLTLEEAETVLSAAGIAIQVRPEDPSAPDGVDTVVQQDPASGTLVDAGATVTVVVRTTVPVKPASATKAKETPQEPARYVVCIDPGHQAHSNSAPEPIGPGSKTVKPKVTGGATGAKTRIPEYEIVLQISMNLKERLESQGVRVVMTRTTNDVNMSNSERAAVANKAKADLFVRVHGDGSPDSRVAGLSTLYPSKNKWTRPFAARSKRAAKLIQSAAVASTGAVDRGVIARSDLAGFNYAKVPSILVETGFLSNAVEDRLLSSPHYQDKVAEGMATGIMAYLQDPAQR